MDNEAYLYGLRTSFNMFRSETSLRYPRNRDLNADFDPESYLIQNTDDMVSSFIRNTIPLRLIKTDTLEFVTPYEVQQEAMDGIRAAIAAQLRYALEKVAATSDFEPEAQDIIDVLEGLVTGAVKETVRYSILSHRWDAGELDMKDMHVISKITLADIQHVKNSSSGLVPKESLLTALAKAALNAPLEDSDVPKQPIIDALKCLVEDPKFGALNNGPSTRFNGFHKLVHFCYVSLNEHGHKYAWIDTCCIDKTSSAELDESIRSMFKWYLQSSMCIIHLGRSACGSGAGKKDEPDDWTSDPWFTRGWTLQELLAPKAVKFYDANWERLTDDLNDKALPVISGIGSDSDSILQIVSRITSIPIPDLVGFTPGKDNIRNRLRWASNRKTTRVEDQAYCLLGIFDVDMSIAYGEGDNAFHRLQVAIIGESSDRSVFLWGGRHSRKSTMLAKEPACFAWPYPVLMHDFDESQRDSSIDPTFMLTNHGLKIAVSLYNEHFTRRWLLDSHESYRPRNVPPQLDMLASQDYRLAVLGYSKPGGREKRGAPAVAVVMLLLRVESVNNVYYTRHPLVPQLGYFMEPPGAPEVIFIR
ncbi:Vegetative incompatibility protein HET-E-1 [Psilocybe cubensis]|uniref:Vegetative incompatibility protein HET-E-1 n=1 Tax=Psilocybe cubensis TaxID=181762 RepID=A0ACB8GVM8_PSICU|nr:Vegetative incompatibility protein HET-E-1 [Psilocybe cubensis]KAH9479030.1 Vegetative incompatibility protein HET-E-1 [Psilocybe cubensis]